MLAFHFSLHNCKQLLVVRPQENSDSQLHNQADTGRLARLNRNRQLATLGYRVPHCPYNGESALPFRSFTRRQAQYNNLRRFLEYRLLAFMKLFIKSASSYTILIHI